MNIILTGQHPRSEKLVSATRDFDRNRISSDQLLSKQADDAKALQQLQRDFAYLSTGLFEWQDLMRPFEDLILESFANSLKRLGETNLFWRILECKSALELNSLEPWIDRYFFANALFAKTSPMVFTLPFLYTFSEFSMGLSLEQISEFLLKIANQLLSYPQKILCFFEPSFGTKTLSKIEKEIGIAFLESLKKYKTNQVVIYAPNVSVEANKEFLFHLPIDGIGIDFFKNSFENVLSTFPKHKLLFAGVIDTQTTRIIGKEDLNNQLQPLFDAFPREQIYMMPSGFPELLPRAILDAKINILKGIA